MLPSTSETLQHVLTQGGVSLDTLAAGAPDDDYDKNDPTFASLLSETRSLITSSDFSRVLEVCLDKGTDVLFDGLRRNVFVDESGQASEEVKLRLAGLLPGLVNWSHLALNGLPNELIDVNRFPFFPTYIYPMILGSQGDTDFSSFVTGHMRCQRSSRVQRDNLLQFRGSASTMKGPRPAVFPSAPLWSLTYVCFPHF